MWVKWLTILLLGLMVLAMVEKGIDAYIQVNTTTSTPAQVVTPAPPLYGGCEEWRPAYGPKPEECR